MVAGYYYCCAFDMQHAHTVWGQSWRSLVSKSDRAMLVSDMSAFSLWPGLDVSWIHAIRPSFPLRVLAEQRCKGRRGSKLELTWRASYGCKVQINR